MNICHFAPVVVLCHVVCRRTAAAALLFLIVLCGRGSLLAQAVPNTPPGQPDAVRPELLRTVSFEQKLNEAVPLDLTFHDEYGRTTALRSLFEDKPVILTLVYYQCPMLCTEVLNGLVRSIKELPLKLGTDFSVVTVSIDPREGSDLAAGKHQTYAHLYGNVAAARAWHFLTGDEAQIKALANSVGFHYAYDAKSGQFAHPTGIMILTPSGRIARYFYGISYQPRDLRFGLIDASENRIGSPVDQVLLYCYHYDPATGRYGILIWRVIQLSGGLTVVGIGLLLGFLFRQEHKGKPRPDSGDVVAVSRS